MLLTGRADLHMHTTVSDGTATVEQMLDHIVQRGDLDVIAITDHDRLAASRWAYSHQELYPFEIIPGIEVTSSDAHILGLWVTEPIRPRQSIETTTAAIHAQGGIAIMAHPMEPTINPQMIPRYLKQPEVLIQMGIDAVEIFNAGALTPGSNWLAQRTFGQLGLPVVGGSDAHMPESIATAITRFKGTTAADLRESLAHGYTSAEGKSWPITTYLKLLPVEIHKRRSRLSAENSTSIPLTPQ